MSQRAIFSFVTSAALLLSCSVASAFALVASVNNVKSDEGQVMIGLFNTAADFPKQTFQKAVVQAATRDASGGLKVTFKDLPPGRYVISAFHDRDANGKLNINMMGIPNEPYGFSGNAPSSFGPPKFDDAAQDVGAVFAVTLK